MHHGTRWARKDETLDAGGNGAGPRIAAQAGSVTPDMLSRPILASGVMRLPQRGSGDRMVVDRGLSRLSAFRKLLHNAAGLERSVFGHSPRTR